jgi:hypothetical protein
MVSTCWNGHSGAVGYCAIPVSGTLHVELGTERNAPDPTAACPLPGLIVQVCPLTQLQLAVVGVATAGERLHSLCVTESGDAVLVSALVGQARRPDRSSGLDHVARRTLWVAEVTLNTPLAGRAACTPALSATGPGNGPLRLRPAPSFR